MKDAVRLRRNQAQSQIGAQWTNWSARRQISRRMLSAYYGSDEKRQVHDKRHVDIQLWIR